MTTYELSDREFHTVLAGLRLWQAAGEGALIERLSACTDIADCGGEVDPLTADEIDALAEALNCGERSPATPTDTTKPFTAGGHLIEVERQIIERLVIDILTAGHPISVHNGETYELSYSTDKAEIMRAVGVSDETTLQVFQRGRTEAIGWVQLIHGNVEDVISDYSLKLEKVCKGANALAERFSGGETDPENIYGSASMRQSIEEDRR